MLTVARGFVRFVDAINYRLGRIVMYGIFAMVGVLLWSSISKTFFDPSLWTLEVAQFSMVAYYILGGPYSLQMGSNVRMDLFYGEWSDRKKAQMDAFTVVFLLAYLGILLYGAIDSTAYSLGAPYNMGTYEFFGNLFTAFFTGGPDAASEVIGRLERSPTAWRPYLWPIKVTIIVGVFLMLLQALSELIKDIATIRGEEL